MTMDISARGAARYTALSMVAIVATQVFYMVNGSAGLNVDSSVIWTIEVVAFLAMAVFGLIALARGANAPIVWAAITLGGIFNVIQVGMGLAMFGPLKDAGEAMAPAMEAILAGAFFFYFSGKLLFGIAGIVLGAALMRGPIAAQIIGALAILAGLAAVVLNLGAMAIGMDLMVPAGAAGTAAALLAALAILVTGRQSIVS